MAERVLITGARSAVALDLARDFRRAGCDVHMADCVPARIARWSRAPWAFHGFAPPRSQPSAFVADLHRLVADIDPVLIVPTCEEIFHLARPALRKLMAGRLLAPPLSVLRALHDKHTFARDGLALGLPVPESLLLTDVADIAPLIPQSRDWVFKPCFSRFGARTLIGPDAGRLAALKPVPGASWIAQRRIVGREYSFYALARRGKPVAVAGYGANWRLHGGASFAFHAVADDIQAMASRFAATLAEAHALTGQFSCDFILDREGRPWLIECNPRATSGLHLLTGTGALARAMLGAPGAAIPVAATDRHLLPALLTYGVMQAMAEGRWREWWAALRGGSDVVGAPGDRRPLAGAMADAAGFGMRARRTGCTLAQATTMDIEWNGEALT